VGARFTFAGAVARALDGIAPQVSVVELTGSTNDDARAQARDGAPHLSTVVSDEQLAGRGRRGRSWSAAVGESLLASWVVRPSLPVERWPLLPLLAGVAAAEAVRARAHVAAVLKWPNDLLADGRKLGGILVEAEPPSFAIVGVGINVSQTSFPEQLRDTATSLALQEAVRLDRADLLAAMLGGFADALADPEEAIARYREMCATLGRAVRIERTGAPPLTGIAVNLDASGALVVEDGAGRHAVASGDVVHLR